MNGTVQLSLSDSNSPVFYLGSMPSARLTSPVASVATGAGFPRAIIQSVSLLQFFRLIVVVGSQRALSGHNRHGQSVTDSMEAGNLFG